MANQKSKITPLSRKLRGAVTGVKKKSYFPLTMITGPNFLNTVVNVRVQKRTFVHI